MLQDYAVVEPRRVWGLARPPQDDDDEARAARLVAVLARRQQERRELLTLLGAPVYARVTVLPLVGGGALGPARGPDGHVLVWGLWSPHRRALIDVFRRVLPAAPELEARAAWATAQQLRYALVRPGTTLTTESLRAWLYPTEGAEP